MRRVAPAAVLAIVAAALIVTPAGARIDHHFSVFTKEFAQHRTSDGFKFREQLFASFNPNDQVGNDHVRCRLNERNHKVKCRAIVHLNGEEGGEGFLIINGNVAGPDHRLNVVGGTDDFAGAAGKVITKGHHLHFDLVR
jgi:hypothetical protein